MSAAHVLSDDPLAHSVFEKLRRVGHDRAHGQTVCVNGAEYGIIANAVCTLQLVHVVAMRLDGPTMGDQRAMVALEIKKNGYPGMDGAAHLMPALMDGLVVTDPARPARHSWRVLPIVELPRCFAPDTSTAHDEDEQIRAVLDDLGTAGQLPASFDPNLSRFA